MATAGIPLPLKSIQPYLTVAKQYERKDAVVSFYVYYHAVKSGMKLAKGDKDSKAFIGSVMDIMERLKKESPDKESFAEMVGQAHVEAAALKLFDSADNSDRAGNFNRAMIKQFYTSSILFGALSQFDDVSVEIEEKQMYAKFKATEISRCLKNGITPTPGPPGGDDSEFNVQVPPPAPGPSIGFSGYTEPTHTPSQYPVYPEGGVHSYHPPEPQYPVPPPGSVPVYPPHDDPNPVPKPRSTVPPQPSHDDSPSTSSRQPAPPTITTRQPPVANTTGGGGGLHPNLTFNEYNLATKYCKYAVSALDYEDGATAMANLTKALHVLRTGKDQ